MLHGGRHTLPILTLKRGKCETPVLGRGLQGGRRAGPQLRQEAGQERVGRWGKHAGKVGNTDGVGGRPGNPGGWIRGGIQGAVQATWESGDSRSRGTTDPIAEKGTVLEAPGGCWEAGALGPLRATHTWTNQSLGGSVRMWGNGKNKCF